jgi:hypothetical protein
VQYILFKKKRNYVTLAFIPKMEKKKIDGVREAKADEIFSA